MENNSVASPKLPAQGAASMSQAFAATSRCFSRRGKPKKGAGVFPFRRSAILLPRCLPIVPYFLYGTLRAPHAGRALRPSWPTSPKEALARSESDARFYYLYAKLLFIDAPATWAAPGRQLRPAAGVVQNKLPFNDPTPK